MVKENGGKWQGSSSDIIKASKFLTVGIYDKPEKVGKFINDNKEFLLWFDNIKVENKRQREKLFTTVSTVPTVPTVSENKQQELRL